MRLLITWLINAASLFVLPFVLPTIYVQDFTVALIAALVLGLVNTLVRPILILLTLPVTILTLGLFIFIINGLLFWFVGSIDLGFRVDDFWTGVFGYIVYSVISWLLSALLLPRKE